MGERLDVEKLASDLRGLEIPARVLAGAEATAEHLSKRAAPGDTVVIDPREVHRMSNVGPDPTSR